MAFVVSLGSPSSSPAASNGTMPSLIPLLNHNDNMEFRTATASSISSGVAGNFNWRDRIFQVVSENLIRIDDVITGAFTTIGTIEGSAAVDTSIGFNFAVIVVKSATGKAYTLDVDDNLVDISGNANMSPAISVANIKEITVYIPFDGDVAFFSNPGAPGDIDVTSFFDAQQLPDRNNAVFNLSDTLYIMGTDSIELFRVVTSPTLPFRSVTGARINNGFIGGLLEYGDTFLFIGKEKDQSSGIYAIGQGRAPKISNERIDKILSEHTQDELAEAIPGTIKVQGHFLATFQLRRSSFGFYKGEWFELETIFDGVSSPWGGGFIAQLNGQYFTAFQDKIGVFDESLNTDYGERVTRSIKMIFIQEDGNWFACSRIELGISQGFNANRTTGKKNKTVGLLTSRDGVLFGPEVFRDLGVIGDYQSRLIWRRIGRFQSFMSVEFRTTQDVNFSVAYVEAAIG